MIAMNNKFNKGKEQDFAIPKIRHLEYVKNLPYRDSNPGLMGESHVS